MSSKKKRKKLKEQYTIKEPNEYFRKDGEVVLNYFKNNPNRYITSYEIINNINLYFNTTSGVSRTIKAIDNYTNYNITTKPARNGGYIYHA